MTAWYNFGYTQAVKTAISISDKLFKQAEKLAQAAKLNKRSYARAKWAVARTFHLDIGHRCCGFV